MIKTQSPSFSSQTTTFCISTQDSSTKPWTHPFEPFDYPLSSSNLFPAKQFYSSTLHSASSPITITS